MALRSASKFSALFNSMAHRHSSPSVDLILQALTRLGDDGRTEDFNIAIDRLELAFSEQDSRWLNELHAALAQQGNSPAVQAFDACVDLLCAEASAGYGVHAQEWRCLSIGALVKKPVGLDLKKWTDLSGLTQILADQLKGKAHDVVVDPVVLTSEAAFDFGPLEAYRHSQLVRSRAGGVSLSFLDKLMPGPSPANTSQTSVLHEVVLNVAFRSQRWATTELMETLGRLVRQSPLLEVGAGGTTLPLQLMEVAPPWSLYTQFLHSGRALRFSALFRDTCRRLRVPPKALQVWVAPLDDPEHTEHLRCGITDRQGNLVAGLGEQGVHDISLYITKVNQFLSAMSCNPLYLVADRQPRELLDDSEGLLVPISGSQWSALERP